MMPQPQVCPSIEELKLLLDESESSGSNLESHLTHCEDCQHNLESLALGQTVWLSDTLRGTAPILPVVVPAGLTHQLNAITSAPMIEPAFDTVAALDTLDDPILEEFIRRPAGERPRLGPYEILSVLGHGGMGVVLQGYDTSLHRPVALKLPALGLRGNDVARQRFLREARAAAAIDHPHVVPIHAVEEWAGVPVLVMAYIQGESLQTRLDREGRMSLRDALTMALGIAEALEAAHSAWLVHRDIKPANILLQTPNDLARLTDFGLARAADDPRITRTGLGAGTPLYMAPEQAEGKPTDLRADLFSLGGVLYAAIAGRPPFAAETLMGTLRRIAEGNPDPIRDYCPTLPKHTEQLLMDLLQKQPEKRPSSARIVAERLRLSLHYLSQGIDPTPKQGRRVSTLVAFLALGIAAIAMAGTVFRFPTDQGTLVVEIEDPQAKVTYDRDGKEITITGVGIQEIKLKTGDHKVKVANGDGPAREELVNITRDGKAIIKASFEGKALANTVPLPVPTRIEAPNPLLVPAIRWLGFRPPMAGGSEGGMEMPLIPSGGGSAGPGMSGSPSGGGLPLPGSEGPSVPMGMGPGSGAFPGSPGGWPGEGSGSGMSGPGGVMPGTGGPGMMGGVPSEPIGRHLVTYTGVDGPVRSVALVDGGKKLVGVTSWPRSDETIHVWDVATGKKVHRMTGFTGDSSCVIALPDDKSVASTHSDGLIRIWNAVDGKLTRTIDAHDKEIIIGIALSPNGKWIASAGAKSLEVRELETGKLISRFENATTRVRTVAFTSDGKYVLSGDETGKVWKTDATTGKVIWSQDLKDEWVEKVLVLPGEGNYLAITKTIHVGNLSDGKISITLGEKGNGLLDLALSPDGKRFATVGYGGEVRLWNAKSFAALGRSQATNRGANLNAVLFSPDGKTLFLGSGGQFNLRTKEYKADDLGIQMWELK